MKKILNTADTFVRDTMEGIEAAYGDQVGLLDGDYRILVSRYPVREGAQAEGAGEPGRPGRTGKAGRAGKVGVVTAGGSGHLPLFLGYVGQGLLDGCAVGEVFASPSAGRMADMIRACDRGRGVLCLYGNYNGDVFNFRLACEDVGLDGIETRQVLARDDVASAPAQRASTRRGVAGLVLAFKTAGAAAEAGMSLEEVASVAQRTLDRTRSLGFALSPCVVPRVGEPTFTVGKDEIEVGMGIHGEAGIETRPMMSAQEVARLAVETIDADMPLSRGEEVCVMVNGLGATPLEEQLIVYRSVHALLAERGVSIVMPHIGEYATSMEMAGLSVTVLRLDHQLRELLQAPAVSPFYRPSCPAASSSGGVPRAPGAPAAPSEPSGVPPERSSSVPTPSDRSTGSAPAAGSGGAGASQRGVVLDRDSLAEILASVSALMTSNRDYLVRLDQVSGDGDLGVSMDDGFAAAAGCLAAREAAGEAAGENEDLGQALRQAARELGEAAPSSLGTILSFGMMGMARSLRGTAGADLAAVARAVQAGVDAIMARAGCRPGEKTVLDAVLPAAQALREHEEAGEGTGPALRAAARAAAEGSEATRQMRAVHGRAAYAGERSVGALDGGAVVGRLIFEGVLAWWEERAGAVTSGDPVPGDLPSGGAAPATSGTHGGRGARG